MDLVVYQMMQLQIMHMSDGYRTVEIFSRTAVTQTYLSVSGERHALPQLSVLSVVRQILEHFREKFLAVFLLKFSPLMIYIIIGEIKCIHDIVLVRTVEYRCGDVESEGFRRKA